MAKTRIKITDKNRSKAIARLRRALQDGQETIDVQTQGCQIKDYVILADVDSFEMYRVLGADRQIICAGDVDKDMGLVLNVVRDDFIVRRDYTLKRKSI